MKVQVTLTFDLPDGKGLTPQVHHKITTHTYQAAINWHCTQAMKWDNKSDILYQIHDKWSEILSNADIEVKIKNEN